MGKPERTCGSVPSDSPHPQFPAGAITLHLQSTRNALEGSPSPMASSCGLIPSHIWIRSIHRAGTMIQSRRLSARPQEGEIFGEFPVRKELKNYTKYPVLIPSPTAAYNCHYTAEHLATAAERAAPADLSYAAGLLDDLSSPAVKGFCVLLMEYLVDASGVQRGDGTGTGGPERTILFGMQRPPLNGQKNILRCNAQTKLCKHSCKPTTSVSRCRQMLNSMKPLRTLTTW